MGLLDYEVARNKLSDLLTYGKEAVGSAKNRIAGLLSDPQAAIDATTKGLRGHFGMDEMDKQWALRDRIKAGDKAALEEYRKLNSTITNKLFSVATDANPAAVGMFLGKGAKTADLAKLAQAEKRIAAGDDAAKVWAETGWGKGPDGHWRFEIPDNKAFYRGSKAAESTYADDVYLHPELYKNYQGLGNRHIKEIPGDQGYWSETAVGIGDKNASSIAAHEFQHGVQGREGFARGGSPDEFNPKAAENARDVLNWRREVEQWMQKNWPNAKPDTETLMNADQRVRDSYGAIGAYDLVPPIDVRNQAINPSFKTGSADRSAMEQMVKEFGLDQKTTPDSAKKMYSRLAGEAEARLTQSRMNMDAAQRAAQYPWQADYFQQATGVPLNGLLFRYD